MHRAHVARIPYDNLSIMLGRPDPVDPEAGVARAGSGGRLGYCFQQNGAFGWLLAELGFSVSRRHGHVWSRPEDELGTELNHLVLVVSGLPTEDNPGGHWWADAGLGEGFAEPLPLVRGEHDVDGWTFGIGAGYGAQAAGRPTGPAAWTYRHLPGRRAERHRRHLARPLRRRDRRVARDAEPGRGFARSVACSWRSASTAPTSARARAGAPAADPASRDQRDLTSYDEWRARAGRRPAAAGGRRHRRRVASLWERTVAAHRAWDEAGRP